jgi:hypothetical protein
MTTKKLSRIQEGVRTEADLTRMLGAPIDSWRDSKRRAVIVWIDYSVQAEWASSVPLARAFVGGTDLQTKTLMVVSEGMGHVAKYTIKVSHQDLRSR